MKIVVIGGTGRIGGKLVDILRCEGQLVVSASPSVGINTVTGEGLEGALRQATVVVDVSDAPSLDKGAAATFFERSGRNLIAAGRAAGVRHHVILSVVGTDRLQASAYFRAKMIQERLVRESGTPFTILRSTQFFEIISAIAQEGANPDVVVPLTTVQPVSSRDLARKLADLATGRPLNRIVEVAGPERFRLDYLATEVLTAYEDPRRIIADPHEPYFGAPLTDETLLPGGDAMIGSRRFEDWLRDSLMTEIPHRYPLIPVRSR
ncbi:SDR family oxidoreductase [Hyphomonas johnsonii]|uniref:NAD-dependent epimerase/dehydratase n=1 Tax=Hyphomonas johnsonii MHS-2 TaxID=1280950 RepID=A0A059FTT2_9PROT|nr:SDR family oxidoreductase [Hyphomonas johnsonii]KCZ94090.1 NAD-dependent epimerase/dehydratase [Hyphomonas johnsonii MHS-2]